MTPARSGLVPPAACPLPMPPQAKGRGQSRPQSRHKASARGRPPGPRVFREPPCLEVRGRGCCRTTVSLRTTPWGRPFCVALTGSPSCLFTSISLLHRPRCTTHGSRVNRWKPSKAASILVQRERYWLPPSRFGSLLLAAQSLWA